MAVTKDFTNLSQWLKHWSFTDDLPMFLQVDSDGNPTNEGGLTGSAETAPVNTGAAAELVTIDVSVLSSLFFRLTPAGLLDAFEIAYGSNTSDYLVRHSTKAHFLSPSGLLIDCGADGASGGDLSSLRADETGFFVLDVMGLNSVKINAAADATTTTDYSWSGR